jgi:hypothetical protein
MSGAALVMLGGGLAANALVTALLVMEARRLRAERRASDAYARASLERFRRFVFIDPCRADPDLNLEARMEQMSAEIRGRARAPECQGEADAPRPAGRKGAVGPSESRGLADGFQQTDQGAVSVRVWCRRCGTGFHDGRQLKGSVGCLALSQDPQDQPQCARLVLQGLETSLEHLDPAIVRVTHSDSMPWLDGAANLTAAEPAIGEGRS